MEINAYYDVYLNEAQETLGNMFEYGINTCHIEPEYFYTMFLNSGLAEQFAKGNPRVIAGMSGGELAKEVILKSTGKEPEEEEEYYLDKTPEFWAGWILAYYQWKTGRSFRKISEYLTITDILCMYPTLHEADVSKFVDTAESMYKRKHTKTYFSCKLKNQKYSIEQLAKEADISEDIIKRLETDFSYIWDLDVRTLYKIAKVLDSTMEDLLEI